MLALLLTMIGTLVAAYGLVVGRVQANPRAVGRCKTLALLGALLVTWGLGASAAVWLPAVLGTGLIWRVWQKYRVADAPEVRRSALAAALFAIIYGLGLYGASAIIPATFSPETSTVLHRAAEIVVLTALALLMALDARIRQRRPARWIEILYVHAVNGFYVPDIIERLRRNVLS
jgi:hypothetical protein